MKIKYLLTLFFLLSIEIVRADSKDKIQIKITDSYNTPLFGVYIIKLPENILLNTTDENGITEISCLYKPQDKFVFYTMGYKSDTLSFAKLQNHPSPFVLNEKKYLLPEVIIKQKRTTISDLVQESYLQINKNIPKGQQWKARYFGEGIFSKLTFCKNIPVQVRQEKGIYITSGNIQNEASQWDKSYHLYFLPEMVARSFDFDCNGRDTLKRKTVNLTDERRRDLNYDVTCEPKIYNAMRTVYLFTPPFTNPKYYNYQLIEETPGYYRIAFSTNKKYFPQKIRVLCKGILEINRENLQLQRMTLEHIDDTKFQFKINRTATHPYQKTMELIFAYTSQGNCYIKTCNLQTKWLYESTGSISQREGCPRPHAAKNQLVEQERWICLNCLPFPDPKIKNKELEPLLRVIHSCPEGEYSPALFESLPKSEEYRQAEILLNQIENIQTQYTKNQNQPYVEWNYINFSPDQWPQMKKIKDNLLQQFKVFLKYEK